MPWSDRIGRRVKLRDLHILLAVAQTRSMARAAADLGVSQPVVSKTLADLEHALGVRLLDRTAQGVEPTAYGRAFIRCGTIVFDELKRGVQELEFLSDPTFGEGADRRCRPARRRADTGCHRPARPSSSAPSVPCRRGRYAEPVRAPARAQARPRRRSDGDPEGGGFCHGNPVRGPHARRRGAR
jgi:Bacterial regulatory helix-turn-helix protein, lysR family